MFSRVALRAGASLLRPEINRGALAIAVRHTTTDEHVKNWEKANAVYYGPDRDTKNFPIFKQPETSPPTRLGFIPATWFEAFYEKTGVTGPYMLGVSVTTMLLSKEYWVVEHGFAEFVAFWIAFYLLTKKVGPGLTQYLDQHNKDMVEQRWTMPLQSMKSGAQQNVDDLEKAIWREDGQKYLFEAKKENVELQLECTYRQRLAEVHNAVKKRLDYQVDVENAQTRFQQKHMVDWIVGNVVKGITPQQEKESITKCIGDLKAMAARNATV